MSHELTGESVPWRAMSGLLMTSGAAPFAAPDTIIARTLPVRDLLDWTTGMLEFVVLLLGAGVLGALLLLLLAARRGVSRITDAATQLVEDTRPILRDASATVAEAHAMARTVRDDVAKVSGAAGAIGDQLLDATQRTAARVREVGEVLDVVQDELEETALAGAQLLRGVRLSSLALFNRRRHRPRRSSHRDSDGGTDPRSETGEARRTESDADR